MGYGLEITGENDGFIFDSGKIKAQCNNFKETFRLENNYIEGLSISIDTKETTLWLKN
mgnify:CR=1 FL=1